MSASVLVNRTRRGVLPTQSSRWRFSQRATGLLWNLTLADAAEKVRVGESGHSQVAITDLGMVPAERLHPKCSYSRSRPFADIAQERQRSFLSTRGDRPVPPCRVVNMVDRHCIVKAPTPCRLARWGCRTCQHLSSQPQPYCLTSSTRRFFARPPSPSFEATGANGPTPLPVSRAAATPCLVTSACTTALARL